jgi:hypothetical protein
VVLPPPVTVALPYGTVTTVVDLTMEAPMVLVMIAVYVDVPLRSMGEDGPRDAVVDLIVVVVLVLVVVEFEAADTTQASQKATSAKKAFPAIVNFVSFLFCF